MKQKSLIKNSFYNVIYKGLNVFFPLVTSMYVSRMLLSDGVGRVASAKNLVTYFTLLAALGLPTYGTKKIAECRDDKNQLEKIFSELYIINFISTMVCVIAYYAIVFNVQTYRNDFNLYLIVGLQIILNIFNIDWFYQGIEQYKYIMVRSFIIKILSFLFIIITVRSQADYLFYAFATVLGVTLNYIFNVFQLIGKIKFQIKNLDILRHLKFLFILFSSAIAVEIYSLSDVTMLTIMTNKSDVGYYSNALNGVKTIKEMIVAVCAVFLPRLSYHYAKDEKIEFYRLAQNGIKILLFFSIPAATGCFLLANDIVLVLFGSAFQPAIVTVRILSLSIITIGLSNFIGYQILIVIEKEKIMFWISCFGACLNIILNSILIPLYFHNGAAIASIITELIVCILYLFFFNKYVGTSWLYKYLIKIVIATLIMAICLLYSENAGRCKAKCRSLQNENVGRCNCIL